MYIGYMYLQFHLFLSMLRHRLSHHNKMRLMDQVSPVILCTPYKLSSNYIFMYLLPSLCVAEVQSAGYLLHGGGGEGQLVTLRDEVS